jgi:NADH:ubiquinone oxidoreductase subunit C/predicted flap endonuclease-1-like 5' DNA nuclease
MDAFTYEVRGFSARGLRMTLATARTSLVPLEPGAVERFQAGLKARAEVALDTVVFTVSVEDYRALCERLYRAGFDFPNCLSGTDMDWGLGVALNLQSLQTKHKVTVRTYVPYDAPSVPSVSDLWGGVEWHEREAYDLVGIHFENHPDLRRILTEDHWTIHPLQRKYNTRGYVIPDWQAKPWPSPAPWQEGYAPFGAAPAPAAAHAAPAKPAAPAVKPAPKPEAASSEAPAASAATPSEKPAALTTPSVTASSETPPSQTVASSEAPAPAAGQTKERKRWEPKGGATAPSEPPSSAPPSSEPASSSAPTPTPTGSTPAVPESQKIVSRTVNTAPVSTDQDDLRRIEGIGPKINEALQGGGITTFMQLAAMSEDQLRGFLETAGLPFAPSVTTWAEQAGFLARGDEAGFKALVERLTAGRDDAVPDESSSQTSSASAETAPAQAAPAQPTEDKPRNPKIKRWEPKS